MGILERLAKVLGKPGNEEPVPRPELGQRAVTGDARFVARIQNNKWEPDEKRWVLAHRLDDVSYRDYDRVRFYPTVRDALTAIRLPLNRSNFHFECTNQDAADLAMEELSSHIRPLVDQLAKGGLEFGRQTCEKVWKLRTNVTVSSSQSGTGPVDRRYPFVWTIKRFAFFSPEDTELLVFPEDGRFAGIRQFIGVTRAEDRDIPWQKLIHFVHDREHDSNYGTPRTKAAVPFVDLATGVYDDATLYFARFACPSLIGYAPPTKREVGKDSDGRSIVMDSIKFMSRALSNIRNAHAVVFPSEFDTSGNAKWQVQPLELGERGMFVEYVLHLNTMIGASLCVPQLALSTVPSSGTYNLGQAQIDLFTQNEEALLDQLRDTINEQLLADFALYNFGPSCPPIRVVFEPVSTDVTQLLLEGLIQNLTMGAPVFTQDGQAIVADWAKLASDKGVPVLKQPVGMMPGMGGMPPMGGGSAAGPVSPVDASSGPSAIPASATDGAGYKGPGTGKPGSKGDYVGSSDTHANMSEAASFAEEALRELEEGN